MDRSNDILSVVVLNSVALVGMTVAWLWADDQATFGDQTSPLALGVAAVALSALGNSLYLLAQRRRITHRLDDLLAPGEEES